MSLEGGGGLPTQLGGYMWDQDIRVKDSCHSCRTFAQLFMVRSSLIHGISVHNNRAHP